jgi:hypothetical protein
MAKPKPIAAEPRSRQGFPKGEPRVTEKIIVSKAISDEIEEASKANGDSKSAFMGRIIRNYLAEHRKKK